MKINYITEPKEQYVTRQKAEGMKYTRTTIHCPLCKGPFSKREFESHVYLKHAFRVDECFAMLYGISTPARCSCGRDLHYSRTYHGFPKSCGQCETGLVAGHVEYKNVDEANKHVAQLEAMLAEARSSAKRMEKEAELEKIPLEQLPFPSRKDTRLLRRVSKLIRIHAVNGEKEELFKLANFLDKLVAENG